MLESGVHILSLDGKDIYISNSYLTPKVNDKGLKIGYKLRDQNGDLNLKRFINTLDYSLALKCRKYMKACIGGGIFLLTRMVRTIRNE